MLVSRGELVEIGGSFRVPEVMERSGKSVEEARRGLINAELIRAVENKPQFGTFSG